MKLIDATKALKNLTQFLGMMALLVGLPLSVVYLFLYSPIAAMVLLFVIVWVFMAREEQQRREYREKHGKERPDPMPQW